MNREMRNCPVCDASAYEADYVYSNHMAKLDEFDFSYIVARCKKCGHHFATAVGTDEEFENYYKKFSKYDGVTYLSALEQQAQKDIVALLEQKVTKDVSILDAGCGSGNLLSIFREHGFSNIQGFDPSGNTTGNAEKLYGLKINKGSIYTIGKDVLQSVDIFITTWVLEHLKDPFYAMSRVVKNLKEGALVVTAVPDVLHFDGLHREPLGELSNEHINFFTEYDLLNLYSRLGLDVEDKISNDEVATVVLIGRKTEKCIDIPFDVRALRSRSLQKYIDESLAVLMEIKEKAVAYLDKETYIYGGGAHTQKLLAMLPEKARKNCVGIIDNNANYAGHSLDGIPIFPITELASRPRHQVLASSFKAEVAMCKSLPDSYPYAMLYHQDV